MSDFDKEAEREKLREKYGEEEEKRKATEQMSELLLKGATMTNAHCTDCGDPIFRYDGQEFCPTCQKPVARDQGADDGDETQGDHIEVADPSDDATVQFGDGQDGDDGQAASETPDTAEANGAADAPATGPDTATDAAGHPPAAGRPSSDATREVPSADPGRTPDPASAAESVGTESGASSEPTAPTPEPAQSTRRGSTRRGADDAVTTELSAAESLLAETVHRFAQRAADTDDPRSAREQLKAAREAAEALDAVRF